MALCDFDDILIILGSGKWNFLYYLNMAIFEFVVPCFYLYGIYMVPGVEHECDTTQVTEHIQTVEECKYSIYLNTSFEKEIKLERKCMNWTYTDPVFTDTMTSEFNLVCDDAYLRPLFTTVLITGSCIGCLVNGFLSDKYGRKVLIVSGFVVSVASVLLSTVAPSLTIIYILRFLAGVVSIPVLQCGYTLCMEVCEPKYRSIIGILLALPWAFGTMWFGVLGYLIRDWRKLTRISTIPVILYIITLFFMDESPRWLIVSGHHTRALKALKKAASWNHATLPSDDDLLKRMMAIQQSSKSQCTTQKIKKSSTLKRKITKRMKQLFTLFRTPELRKITLLMYIVFIVSAAVFYGLTLSGGNFKLDPFLYVIIGGLMEVPAYSLSAPVIMKMGRIPFTSASYFICGIAILALVFIPPEIKWLLITVASIGKLFISAAFQAIYLIATENFPTEVRMQGLGSAAFISTFGSITAPLITDLIGAVYPRIPSLIFGGLSLIAGVTTIFIPETLNKHMAETIQQLEENAKQRKNKISSDEEEKMTNELNYKFNSENEN